MGTLTMRPKSQLNMRLSTSVLVKVRMPFLKPASSLRRDRGHVSELRQAQGQLGLLFRGEGLRDVGPLVHRRGEDGLRVARARGEGKIAPDVEVLARPEAHELSERDPLLRVLALGVDALALHRGEPHLGREDVVVGRGAGILALLGVLEMLLESGRAARR